MKVRLFILLLFFCQILVAQDTIKQTRDSASAYKNGIYTGQSRSKYTAEPYWGIVRVTLDSGRFTDVNFIIRDSALHETFNPGYAKHFAGNEMYIQQTKNDWKGVNTYPGILLRKQKIGKADVISGATWSFNIFRASLEDALNKAK